MRGRTVLLNPFVVYVERGTKTPAVVYTAAARHLSRTRHIGDGGGVRFEQRRSPKPANAAIPRRYSHLCGPRVVRRGIRIVSLRALNQEVSEQPGYRPTPAHSTTEAARQTVD